MASVNPSKKPSDKATNETVKETFESIVIAFVLAFVFRAYVVEAFVIPTGSMAPTLLGQHIAMTCPQCGYHFNSDAPDSAKPSPGADHLATSISAICPMCHFSIPISAGTRLSYGDRILVHKYLYSLTDPKRWDVVVFKNPQDPDINFIKRLVGLPNEHLWIIDGNIYTRPFNTTDKDWKIARKSDRPEVQRAVWQPVYHSEFIPLDGGKSSLDRGSHEWKVPWVAKENAAAWKIENQRDYAYDDNKPGSIEFNFSNMLWGGRGYFAYNQLKDDLMRDALEREPMQDVRLAAKVEPKAGGLQLELSTTARLDDPKDRTSQLVAKIDPKGFVSLESLILGEPPRTLASGGITPLPIGQSTSVELWYVDQEASLWIEGKRVLNWQFELPIEMLKHRRPLDRVPTVGIRVNGSPVVLHEVELDRDIHYLSAFPNSPNAARAGLDKRGSEPVGDPLAIENDEFFCLGDNSPFSSDGRFWNSVNPWIEYRMLSEHQLKMGVVPRKLMMGRAFFVYFPAPLRSAQGFSVVVPNFGEMRFIH